ncbi:hypothetical protein PoB_005572100 [Plakobranchus ocellatus]|uniref:Uncharacterized protein n=1 Tax=Plakobranchus ocellatus TaxID=259542 RepID=A0AAV4C1H2_9GAST|nr:hypothetical protein PoB_005572100 [Plakobranchus ocellatus]
MHGKKYLKKISTRRLSLLRQPHCKCEAPTSQDHVEGKKNLMCNDWENKMAQPSILCHTDITEGSRILLLFFMTAGKKELSIISFYPVHDFILQ